jgi:hypothetical protein
MSPAPYDTRRQINIVGDAVPDATLGVQALSADGTPRGDLFKETVLDVDGLNMVLDGLGAVLRLEGRLYQVATGQTFDVDFVWFPVQPGQVQALHGRIISRSARSHAVPPDLVELHRLMRLGSSRQTRVFDPRALPLQTWSPVPATSTGTHVDGRADA